MRRSLSWQPAEVLISAMACLRTSIRVTIEVCWSDTSRCLVVSAFDVLYPFVHVSEKSTIRMLFGAVHVERRRVKSITAIIV